MTTEKLIEFPFERIDGELRPSFEAWANSNPKPDYEKYERACKRYGWECDPHVWAALHDKHSFDLDE